MKENPAKSFLRRYRAICGRINALQRAIDEAMERAFNTGVTLKEVKVLSSPAEHDPMARDVCNAVDACEILYTEKAKAEMALQEILSAINSLDDERQKEVLTRRYINGDGYPNIAEQMSYSEPAIYIIHGRALVEVNKWLDLRSRTEQCRKSG